MKVKKVLDTILFKTCIVRREIIESEAPDGSDFEWKAAYSLVDGSYIGDCDNADYFEKKGILPQAIPGSGNKVSSIGFCKEEQKWYGWSHRAIFGFGVGSRVKRGDCAYQPADPQDMLDDNVRFWSDDDTIIKSKELNVPDPHGDRDGLGILVETENKNKSGLGMKHWEPYPDKWGKGEWEAKTLEDAKQMAIDFARSVS
jgi:hypothetical protein